MSLLLIKSLLAVLFLIASLIAVASMLHMMGKSDKKTSPNVLRRIHKTAGFLSFILLIVISYFCIKYWVKLGDQASLRAVFHAVLAFGLIIIFILKISIVQFYKQFLRYVPVLGMIVFCFAFVVFCTSAGYFFLTKLCAHPTATEETATTTTMIPGNIGKGRALFEEKCSSCHFAERDESKLGPGLKGLLKKETLPFTGRPATLENVRAQLTRPTVSMPSFASLSTQELADLLEYLKSL